MKCRLRTFRWNKEERKVLGKPKRTYAIMRGDSLVKVSDSKNKLKKYAKDHNLECMR